MLLIKEHPVFSEVLNPHGSDETRYTPITIMIIYSAVLNPHGSDETAEAIFNYKHISEVLNPHGSDETKVSASLF